VIRFNRSGLELLGSLSLEWSTLGLGAAALLIASPGARQTARSLAVSAIAGGMRLAQGISDFGGQVRSEMSQAMQRGRQPQGEQAMHEPAPPEAPLPM
jgi:hypothetical protein